MSRRPARDSMPSRWENGEAICRVQGDVQDERRYSSRSSALLGAPLMVLITQSILLLLAPEAQPSSRGEGSSRSGGHWLLLRCWKSAAASCIDKGTVATLSGGLTMQLA